MDLANSREQEIINEEQDSIVEKRKEITTISKKLRTYLFTQVLLKDKITDPIYEEDIDKMLEKIEDINKVRTNKFVISGEIATEFIDLIKEKAKAKKIELGLIIVDIGKLDFSIKKFVENAKGLSFMLKFRIISINDLKEDELGFLKNRYGILYEYADNDYHIDELFELVSNMKMLIQKNEDKIKVKEKNLARAKAIANIVFQEFNLYVPKEIRVAKQEIEIKDGEKIVIPNIRIWENTLEYANLGNIFSSKTADYVGMRKLCKECLRNDGYQMIERSFTINNDVVKELNIDNQKYGIEVTRTGMDIVEM